MTQIILIIIFFLSYICYNTFYLKLVEAIFAVKHTCKKRIIYSVICSGAGTLFLYAFSSMSSLGYVIMLIFYFITVRYYFIKENFLTRIACVLTFNIHIMVARAICSSIYSIISGKTIYDISMNMTSFWIILILTTYLSLLLTLAILKVVEPKYLKAMKQKTEQMYAYVSITFLGNIFLIAMGSIYIKNIKLAGLSYFLIFSSIIWLFAMYVCLFMLVGFDILRDKKDVLEKDSYYKNAMLNSSIVVVEIDVYKNSIIRLFRTGKEVEIKDTTYTDYLCARIFRSVNEEDAQKVIKLSSPMHIYDSYNNGTLEYSYNFKTLGAESRWLRANIVMSTEEKTGALIAILSIIDDVHDNIMKSEALEVSASKDAYLDILNKAATANAIDKLLKSGTKGALFLIDLDNFKAINDNFGHAYGDDVLVEVVSKISKHFRKEDIIGRIGGDEFVVFLNANPNDMIISNKAVDICKAIKKTYVLDNKSVTISSSIGISLSQIHGKTFDELYKTSDLAMYQSKRSGKNRFTIYS